MVPFARANQIKKPNVSGQFYPANANELNSFFDTAFERAGTVAQNVSVELLVSPHAGYVYSGYVAAYGYKAIQIQKYSTIIVIGPSHYHAFEGASIWPKGQFETPMGSIAVDETLAEQLMSINKDLRDQPEVYTPEHSIEVQLPFIIKDFPHTKIVPILMGNPDPAVCLSLAQALNQVVGNRNDVLVLISTDLSHYHPDQIARPMDMGTLKTVVQGDVEGFWNGIASRKMEACGFTALTTGMLYAKMRGLSGAQLLRYANSGDETGDLSRVVGYSSIIFYKPDVSPVDSLNAVQRKRLIEIARSAFETFVKTGKTIDVHETDPRLNQIQGAFVTLKKQGRLRGCIGNIIGEKPLVLTVRDMAIAAASQDPRFPAVTSDEISSLDVEVSVLSVPSKITNPAAEIKLGVHGVIVSRGMFNRGVFLPQVATETGMDLEQFMGELCSQKAGLPRDCWKDPKTTIEVFSADVFNEKDVGM
ncbi:MAG: AmmeMemoRadiSam system protein B [Candidatus Omnitrophica bacterium]|nr:AmmeMemoRadiSam system protein B [Candidatus Omnitrophota bacterium]